MTNKEYDEFVMWLATKGEILQPHQKELAMTILEWPIRSGKTWLVNRLHKWDRIPHLDPEYLDRLNSMQRECCASCEHFVRTPFIDDACHRYPKLVNVYDRNSRCGEYQRGES